MPAIAELRTELDDATAALVTNVTRLTDAEAREPSLLPGWSRGHVLTHLARNAEGGTRLLDRAVAGLNDERDLAPLRATLHATDTGRDFHLHGPEAGTEEHISGTETSILAWLMGRSDGAALTHDTPGPLPAVPGIYYT